MTLNHGTTSVPGSLPPPIPFLIGCDCDPDRERFGGTTDSEAGPFRWEGVEKGIALFREIRRRAREKLGWTPRVCWNVRADDQIAQAQGDPAWCLKRFSRSWGALSEEGDEIGWHPHLWRRRDGGWIHEMEDAPWITQCYEAGHGAFACADRPPPETVHAGCFFHNGTTLRVAASLGVRLDYSATPGICTMGVPGDECDWATTGPIPYSPSASDYRRPARDGEGTIPLCEAPKTGLAAPIVSVLRHASENLRKGEPPLRRLTRRQRTIIWNVAMHPILVRGGLRRLLEGERPPYLIAYFHADELLGRKDRRYRFDLYSADHLWSQLETLTSLARRRGWLLAGATGRTILELASASAR